MQLHTTHLETLQDGSLGFRAHLFEEDEAVPLLRVVGEGPSQLEAVRDLAFKLVEIILETVPKARRVQTPLEEEIEARKAAVDLLYANMPNTTARLQRWIATGDVAELLPSDLVAPMAETLLKYRRVAREEYR